MTVAHMTTPQLLLVDDDQNALFALTELLGDIGARLVTAGSGEDALRLVLKERFDAILLDVRLPGMDGFEVAAAIRSLERTRQTPILFMSAEDDRRQRPREALAADFLRKPLAPEVLRPRLQSLLQAWSPA
jgi:CheY-like chemotaxis protein